MPSLSYVADNWLQQVASAVNAERRKELYTSAIEGELTSSVYAHLNRGARRTTGVFFSGPGWASVLAGKVPEGRWRRYIDPSAGTGDLLIEIATRFRKKSSLRLTLESWSERLIAIDLEPEFLRICWLRIASLALVRHGIFRKPNMEIFCVPDHFRAGNFLDLSLDLRSGDCVITNPPYQRINRPNGANGGGKRSAAAFHLEKLVASASRGVGIVALVPDVLRSGRNYQKFRSFLRQSTQFLEIESHGQFSCGVDVDVSIISGVIGRRSVDQVELPPAAPSFVKISDLYKVSVGSVVPHRDSEDGMSYPYITARSLPKWGVLQVVDQLATYNSKNVTGPFVVIRRTSSPSDKKRAVATVVNLESPVLVENHLIVVHPIAGGLHECIELVRSLEDSRTDAWLNEHIRCRHLTVGSIREMPLYKSGG